VCRQFDLLFCDRLLGKLVGDKRRSSKLVWDARRSFDSVWELIKLDWELCAVSVLPSLLDEVAVLVASLILGRRHCELLGCCFAVGKTVRSKFRYF